MFDGECDFLGFKFSAASQSSKYWFIYLEHRGDWLGDRALSKDRRELKSYPHTLHSTDKLDIVIYAANNPKQGCF